MTAPSTQVTTLLTQFGLTTAAEELVPRLTQAGHPEALPVLLEVLEAEAEARRQRRIARLRRAARLPPGKTFATLDTGRWPVPVVQQSRLQNSRGIGVGAVLSSLGEHDCPGSPTGYLVGRTGGTPGGRSRMFRRVLDRALGHPWVTDARRAPRGVAGGALVMSRGARAGRR